MKVASNSFAFSRESQHLSCRLQSLVGLEALGDVAQRGHGELPIADRDRREADFDRHLSAFDTVGGEHQSASHGTGSRSVGVLGTETDVFSRNTGRNEHLDGATDEIFEVESGDAYGRVIDVDDGAAAVHDDDAIRAVVESLPKHDVVDHEATVLQASRDQGPCLGSGICWHTCLMAVPVFLLDDHEVVRQGVRALLESAGDVEVVGEAGLAADALARIKATRPKVAILDVRLPDGNGVEVCREVRSECPEVFCLMLTSYSDDEALFEAIMAGASGYVLKQIRGNELIQTVKRVARGESLLDPAVTGRVLERLRGPSAEDERLARLSEQERRILDLIAEGFTNRQIGEHLHLAEKTVKNYVSNMLAKLDMERRTEAAVFATRLEISKNRRPAD